MSLGAEVTLDQLAGDPHPVLARLRETEPVAWLPAIDGWLVTRRDLAADALRTPDAFTVDDPRFSTAQVIGPSMLSTDGSGHRRHRAPFADPFRGGAVGERYTGWIDRRARHLVAGIAAAGGADLRAALAGPLAVDVASEAVGLEAADRLAVAGWYDDIVAAVDAVTAGGAVPPAGQEAYGALRAAILRAARRPDTTAATAARGGELTPDEVAANAAVILFGAVVTSEGATAATLHFLLSHPDQLVRVRADRSLIPGAVEESLRLEPAAAVVDRYATRDVQLGGAVIERGDLVRVSIAAANRDPATFEHPDRFDIDRPNAAQHLAFAVGPHACLGIHLARLETRLAVNAVLDLLPGLRLDGPPSRPTGLVFRAPPRVAARWD